MAGRILIVDGVVTNRIWLKTKLCKAFYSVDQAANGAEAMRKIAQSRPDLVVLGPDLCEASLEETCHTLKSTPDTATIPLVAVQARPDGARRLAAYHAGAEAVLSRPFDDGVFLARLRTLMRGRDIADDLRLLNGPGMAFGFAERPGAFERRAHVQVLAADAAQGLGWVRWLSKVLPHELSQVPMPHALRQLTSDAVPDAFVLVPGPTGSDDGLRLLAELRARAATRGAGVVLIQETCRPQDVVAALDLGADDVLPADVGEDELALRIAPVLTRKHRVDKTRADLRNGLRAAVIDPLTGLYNRRYAMPDLARMAKDTARDGGTFAVMLADLDHFKSINDRYGHAVGDAVLVEVAERLRNAVGPSGLLARIGGEEFLVALADTDLTSAQTIARRLCDAIGTRPIAAPGNAAPIPVTISVGVALGTGREVARTSPEDVANHCLSLADKALYAAKLHGRNKVTLSRSAA